MLETAEHPCGEFLRADCLGTRRFDLIGVCNIPLLHNQRIFLATLNESQLLFKVYALFMLQSVYIRLLKNTSSQAIRPNLLCVFVLFVPLFQALRADFAKMTGNTKKSGPFNFVFFLNFCAPEQSKSAHCREEFQIF
jgi:hypothetical protein